MAPPLEFKCPENRAAVDKTIKALEQFDEQINQAGAWLEKFATESATWTGEAATAVKGPVARIAWFYKSYAPTLRRIDDAVREYGKAVDTADEGIRKLKVEYDGLSAADKEEKRSDLQGRLDGFVDNLEVAGYNASVKLWNIGRLYATTPEAGTQMTSDLFPAFQLPKVEDVPLPKSVVPGTDTMPPAPGRMVKGKESKDVRQLQAALKKRGWNIEVDGKFGPQTEAVIRQFQTNKNLPVSGKVGWTTWNALWTKKIVP